jgi:hypothetical protein
MPLTEAQRTQRIMGHRSTRMNTVSRSAAENAEKKYWLKTHTRRLKSQSKQAWLARFSLLVFSCFALRPAQRDSFEPEEKSALHIIREPGKNRLKSKRSADPWPSV